jgi:hypothetical protein
VSKYKKIIVAGPLVIEAVYPAPHPRDSLAVRQGKKALSSEAQQRMNLKYAYQKLELEIAANFGVNDLFVALTYDEAHLPASRKQAVARIQKFWRQLRNTRSAAGQELRYLYVTEGKHGDGRLHHHALINATGTDYDLIRSLWPDGQVEFRRIRIDREQNFESLARYLCKEQRERLGQRLWSGSRNLHKPETECFRVDDDTSILPPPGAMVLADSGDRVTEYGHFRYIKFLSHGWDRQTRPRAVRRRRRE